MKILKDMKRCAVVALAIAILANVTTEAFATNYSGAFINDVDEQLQKYSAHYSWDTSKYSVPTYDFNYHGQTVNMHRYADNQDEFLRDNLETTEEYLGITSALSNGGGGDGSSMVQMALSQVYPTCQDCLERNKDNKVKYNNNGGYAWCCAFISWCAKQCGYIDSGLFCNTAACISQFEYLTQPKGGHCFAYYDTMSTTPMGGSAYTPVPGDIMFFGANNDEHIGIIVSVEENGWYTVEGNTSGYYSPVKLPAGCQGVTQNHYTANNIHGWTGDRAAQGHVVHVIYPASSNGEIEDTGDNEKTIYLFYRKQLGLNTAAACTLLGVESVEDEAFNPDILQYGKTWADMSAGRDAGYGLFQWTNSKTYSAWRFNDLVAYCNANGFDYRTLTGQLWFMKHELTEVNYYLKGNTLGALQGIPNTAQAAADAVPHFMKWYMGSQSGASERASRAMNRFYPKWSTYESQHGLN